MIQRLLTALPLLLAAAALAQPPAVTEVEQLPCLPREGNAALEAQVERLQGGDSVRLYFRRVHPAGAFYYVEMKAQAPGSYWASLPKPEDRRQQPVSDPWWQSLQQRDWLADIGVEPDDREDLEEWFEELENEAAEYFVAVHDSFGRRSARSRTMVVEVRTECEERLPETPQTVAEEVAKRVGFARNLTVGETSDMQFGEPVFHWLCDGIVTRIDHRNVLRADEYCRACVVALVPPWIPASAGAVAAGVIAAEVIEDDDQPPATPSRP